MITAMILAASIGNASMDVFLKQPATLFFIPWTSTTQRGKDDVVFHSAELGYWTNKVRIFYGDNECAPGECRLLGSIGGGKYFPVPKEPSPKREQ